MIGLQKGRVGRCRALKNDFVAGEPRREGWTLLELVIALSVMLVAFGGVTMATLRAGTQKREASQTLAATEAALEVIGELKRTPLDEVFARFNENGDDDPDGPGTAPGSGFEVQGLRAPDGVGERVGIIEFPGDGMTLLESDVDVRLGMPRDLNGDGDAVDSVTDYELLPVRIRVRWSSPSGQREIALVSTLYEL